MTSRDRLAGALESLRASGKRVTTPKRLVAEVLAAAQGHLTADDIRLAVQRNAPTVSTSTVYRILDEFDELGIVLHSHAGGQAAVYHLADAVHAHLHCESCGQVVEVPADHLESLARRLRSDHGFVLDRHHVALSGTCAGCVAKASGKVKK